MRRYNTGLFLLSMVMLAGCGKPEVNVVMTGDMTTRLAFAGEQLKQALVEKGYEVNQTTDEKEIGGGKRSIYLNLLNDTTKKIKRDLISAQKGKTPMLQVMMETA